LLRGEDGATLVETAISAVLLFTILFGIFEFGIALYSYNVVSESAREATRFAIVRGSTCGLTTPCPATAANVQSYVRGLSFPGIKSTSMTVTTVWPTTGSACTPSASPCNNQGNLVKVTVSYQFPLNIPFVRSRTLTMTSASQMVISQ
jgi:Flp pilus assembly protein TadG